ncbi:MAG: hypothetical protein ABFS23_08005 [Pseudomonadota bacterium]
MTDTLVHFVVALDAEAKPLIAWFGLKRQQPDKGFPVFRHAHVALVVSGPGKANAAAATAHLHARCGFPRDALWLNIGIAGHGRNSPGDAFVVHGLGDAGSGRRWFPPQAVTAPWPGEILETRDAPADTYPAAGLVDMEAAGFYATACRFSTSELVQVIKVVSDNPDIPAERLKPTDLPPLIGAQLDDLDLFLHRLGRLANELHDDRQHVEETKHALRERWHFTASQDQQLGELLRRWHALGEDAGALASLGDAYSAADVLARMRQHLDTLPLRFP